MSPRTCCTAPSAAPAARYGGRLARLSAAPAGPVVRPPTGCRCLPTASSAPNAASRIPSASGTAVHSARRKSSPIVSSNHLLALASPNCSTVTAGYAAPAAATASSTGCTRSSALSPSPTIENCTSALCRSPEISPTAYGSRRSVTCPVACTPATTSPTAAWNPAASAVNAPLCTSTISPAGCLVPASLRMRVARAESPAAYSSLVICRWPTAAPISVAATTSSSQPKMAVLRCRTLQPPSVAARLPLPVIEASSHATRAGPSESQPRRGPRAVPCAGSPAAPAGVGRGGRPSRTATTPKRGFASPPPCQRPARLTRANRPAGPGWPAPRSVPDHEPAGSPAPAGLSGR
jgi:hypothetical protein